MMLLTLLTLFLLQLCETHALRPLVLIHGVTSDYKEFSTLEQRVKADFPSMKVFSLDGGYNDDASLISLLEQVPVFSRLLKNISDQYGNVTLLGYSQGGAVARGIAQMTDNHKIHTLISLSAPGNYAPLTLNCFQTNSLSF